MQHDDKYYVTVIACNYAGLCTAKSSDGVLVDRTPPVIIYVRDGLVGADLDFQVSMTQIYIYVVLDGMTGWGDTCSKLEAAVS